MEEGADPGNLKGRNNFDGSNYSLAIRHSVRHKLWPQGFTWYLFPLLECSDYWIECCAEKSHNITLFQTLSLKLCHNANLLSYSEAM